MAKSKNHTSHHNNRKDHRNGIKRPRSHRFTAHKGVEQKYMGNLRHVRIANQKAHIKYMRLQANANKNAPAAKATA